MPSITITVSPAQSARVIDALCTVHGYTGFEADGTTVQTKADFIKQLIIRYLKNEIKAYEAGVAAANAREASIADVETNVNLT